MTDRPSDHGKEAERVREEKDRRSEKLKESWRKNHPAEGPDEGRPRPPKPKKGEPT